MSKPIRYGAVLLLIVIAIAFWWWVKTTDNNANIVTATVERGDIREVVAVSGFVEADNTANLSFPTTGRVSEIFIEEGDTVLAGTLLASIGQEQLAAERRAALANLTKAEAARDELQNGQTLEERAVTESTLAQANAAWEQTVATELQKIKNAQVALRSNDLVAYPTDPEEDATAPAITGSFNCSEEGQYELEIYRSDSDSGFSIKYNGLEKGILPLTFDNPASLGNCGLSLQFTEGDTYENSVWTISVPNFRSTTYLAYQNALSLAEQQASQNIQAAKDALTLAKSTATKNTAAPRVEALLAANAAVSAAQADLARIDARFGDYAIYAPFNGIITDVSKLPGEIATTEPLITLLAEDAFTLNARIPEIDITKINTGQHTTVVFDANTSEPLEGTVAYVSPLAVEIDGVAYFEAKVELEHIPSWIKSGLNADINIVVAEHTDVLRLPRRFIVKEDAQQFVLIQKRNTPEKTPVTTGAEGNNGYIEVTNLTEGTTVVAP